MKNSRELNAYLSRIAQSAGWDEPGGDGAAVAVPRKLYRVSEIATHMGLTRQTLHNYATIGLITEERRTDGGQRLFDESVFERLALIQRLKRTHRLHEIRRMLDVAAPEMGAVPFSSRFEKGTVPISAEASTRPGEKGTAPFSELPEKGAVPFFPPPSPGARSMMERSQDLVSLSHLADDPPHTTHSPATSLPREAEVARNSEVVSGAPHEPSPLHRERKTPTDEQPEI
jgi:DNA-binding transcriptional MerR regulator